MRGGRRRGTERVREPQHSARGVRGRETVAFPQLLALDGGRGLVASREPLGVRWLGPLRGGRARTAASQAIALATVIALDCALAGREWVAKRGS